MIAFRRLPLSLVLTLGLATFLCSPALRAEERPAAEDADRGFELRLGLAQAQGMSLAIFPIGNLGLEAGYGYQTFAGYSFLGLSWGAGAKFFGSVGALWDQPILNNVLTRDDELSVTFAVRHRWGLLAQVSGFIVWPKVEAGSYASTPVMAGVTYTYWILPSHTPGLDLVSKILDLGVFARLEVGPDFVVYKLKADPVSGAPEHSVSRTEVTWNLALGLVL